MAFGAQIYFDFSGYTDIARGTSRLFGIDLCINFQQPYLATSITDFWWRWHISLSSWLRDYLYIPLGGNQHGPVRTYANLMLTMLLGGLWHGASWNFVIRGGIHGLCLAIERFRRRQRKNDEVGRCRPWLSTAIRRATTFTIACLLWVPLRAESLTSTADFLYAMITNWDAVPNLSLRVACWLLLLDPIAKP